MKGLRSFGLESLEARVFLSSDGAVPMESAGQVEAAEEIISEQSFNTSTSNDFLPLGFSAEEVFAGAEPLEDAADNEGQQARPELSEEEASPVGPVLAGLDPTLGEPDRPLLVVHGIVGSFPSVEDFGEWLITRGADPEMLLADPLTLSLEDLLQTLVNTGYTLNEDLFAANYDWRMTPGPTDQTVDGRINNENGTALLAEEILDANYEHGVDYFGYWLARASLAWAADHGGRLPDEVDVVAHSTGGLVVRVYIQSDAYGGSATVLSSGKLSNGLDVPAGTLTADGTPITTSFPLPRIHDFITMGVPMRGAPGPFLLSQDDWGMDISYVLLGKVMAAAYEQYLYDQDIAGPGSDVIEGYTRGDTLLSPVEFISRYCPTLQSLTATYPFIFDDPAHLVPSLYEEGNNQVTFNETAMANLLAIDLNDGLDLLFAKEQLEADWSYTDETGRVHLPTFFIGELTGNMTVVYTNSLATSTALTRRVGPASWYELGDFEVTPFCELEGNNASNGQVWYASNVAEGNPGWGDGSVPTESSLGLYRFIEPYGRRTPAPNLRLVSLNYATNGESHSHTGMLSSTKGIMAVLEELDRADASFVQTGSQSKGVTLVKDYLEWSGYSCTPPSTAPAVPPGVNSPQAAIPGDEIVELTLAQLEAVADGIDALQAVTVAAIRTATEVVQAEIALLERAIGAGGGLVLESILNATESAFASASAAVRSLPDATSADELFEALVDAGIVLAGSLVPLTENVFEFTIDFTTSVVSTAALALGEQATALGIALSSLLEVTLTEYFQITATVQVDLTQPTDEVFGITTYSAAQGVYADESELSGTATLGSSGDTAYAGAEVDINAYAHEQFADPSGDNRLTSAELNATPASSFATVSGKGHTKAALPTATPDEKVVYANSTNPFGTDADIIVGSINFEAIKDRLLEVLEALAAVGDALEDPVVQTALHVPLPFLEDVNNNTLDELLTDDRYGFGLDEFFNLVDVLLDYCENAGEPNLAEFIAHALEALRMRAGEEAQGELAHGPISLYGGFDVDSDAFDLVFEMDFEKAFDIALTEEGLGAEVDALGLDLNIPVTATLGFEAEFVLSINLAQYLATPAAGISKNDVSLEVNRIHSTFDLAAPDIDATLTFGFLTAGIVDGSAALNTTLDLAVNSGNPITLAQFESILTTSIISLTPAPSSSLLVELPLSASVNGTEITDTCTPLIVIQDNNLFDSAAPTVTTTDFDCIQDFGNLSPADVLVMLKRLGDWLEQFRDSSFFDLTVPFSSGTTMGDLFDFSTAFVNAVYEELIVQEIVATGVQAELVVSLGRLEADANFTLQLDDQPAVSVTVAAADTTANNSLEDLVGSFNAGLSLAGLGGSVEMVVTSNRRLALRLKKESTASVLTLNVPDPDGIASTPNDDAMVAEIGFNATQFSIETPCFSGVEELGELISEALAENGIPLDVALAWNDLANEISMKVEFNEGFAWETEFDFDPDLGLGPLAEASAGGTFTFSGQVHAEFTLGFDLNPKVAPQLRTNPLVPPPSSGDLTATANFILKLDNDRYEIVVPMVTTNASLADLVADINAQFTVANTLKDKVIAYISGNAIVLSVLDEDADGDGVFDAGEDLNGDGDFDSQLGDIYSIQILGESNDTAFTEIGFTNGAYDRPDVKGLYIENVILDGSASLSAADLDAAFRFGVFSIIAEDGAAEAGLALNATLEAEGGGTRFYIDEASGAVDFESVVKNAPEFTGYIDITAPTVTVEPELVSPEGELRLYIPDINQTDYNSAPYHPTTNSQGLFITMPTVGGLGNFSCLTVLNIIQSLDTIADQLEEMQMAGFLGQSIPLINMSIGDILDVAGNFAELIEGLATADEDTIETLEADLEEFFQVSDPGLITLSIDDYSPTPFSPGSATTKPSTAFNPSGLANALIFKARENGTTYGGALIELVDDGRYTGTTNAAEAEYDSENNILRIYYHAGFTTASTIATTVSSNLSLPFEADLDTATESGLGTGTISLTALKFSLHYNLAFGDYLALDLGLADLVELLPENDPARDLLAGITSFVQLEGSANLNITAGMDFLLEFGIDVSNPCSPVPFLYDTTSATISAAVRGTDIDFTASVGPLGIYVRDGTVTIDRDGDAATTGDDEDAEFAITINDVDLDGRHYFREGLGFVSDLEVTLEAGASAELPLFFPLETIPVDSNDDANGDGHPDNELVINIPDLSNLFDRIGNPVSITTPDLLGLLTDFNVCDLVTNATVLLDGLDALLEMIQDALQSEVLSRNLPLVGKELSKAGNFIQDFREGLLADIRLKLTSIGDPLELVKEAFWNVLGPAGLNLLVDENGDPVQSADVIDIDCQQVEGEVVLLFNIWVSKTLALVDTTSNPVGFDIGIPGLGLAVEANVVVEVGFTLNLLFGLSSTDGFFFDTNGDDGLDTDDRELTVGVFVTVPGLKAKGQLWMLEAEISEESDGEDSNGAPRSESVLDLGFSVDIFDADGRLTFSEMVGGGFDLGETIDVDLGGSAQVHLDLDVSFGEDARFPRFLAEIDGTWEWDALDEDEGEGAPQFSFNNVRLDLGSFISKFLIPILKDIKSIVDPAKPLIDLLTAELPVFSELAGEPLTLLILGERAGLITPTTRQFIEAVDAIFTLVNDTSVSGTDSILLDLGDIAMVLDSLGNVEARDELPESGINPLGSPDDNANTFMESLQAIGFTFPFLKVSEIFKLLTGGDVTFVEYRMPLLEFEATIDFKIPIFPPLYIIFGGGIGATIDLTFGYDTVGLRKFASNPDKKISDLAEGFFVKDVDDYGKEIPEITLSGGLFAGAVLDILVAEAGVTGGIYADIVFDLRDPDEDGKVRLAEILANAAESPLCVFDMAGRIYVSLDAFLEVHLLIADIEKEWNFGEITLLEFGLECPQPELASFDTNGDGKESDSEKTAGQLVLHMGEYAALRKHGNTSDGNETFIVRSTSQADDTNQAVTVSFGGLTLPYSGVKSLLVKAGRGNDTIDLTGVHVSATVYGGEGDDVIKASRGTSSIYYGEDGNDTISAEEAVSGFEGGADEFHGGGGDDTLTGHEGDDKLYGDDGADGVWGGLGNDTIEGGEGNDELFGEEGNDVVSGDGGGDFLDGDDGADSLNGGDGADTLEGGAGDDKLVGNSGNDFLDGGTGDDALVGDDGTITSILDITGISGTGNDTLAGGPGDDTLVGGGGDDALYGGTHVASGRTTVVTVVYRQVGDSLTAEPDGADFLDGGEGNDVLFADDAHSGMVTSFAGAELGDRVWLDLDEDGVQDANEPGLSNVTVELFESGGTIAKARTVTDQDGNFRFTGLSSGDYFLKVTALADTSFTLYSVGEVDLDSDFTDSDGDGTGESDVFHLENGMSDLTLDAGLIGGVPTISIDDTSVVEGANGLVYLYFTVSLSSVATEVITVCFATGLDSDALTVNAAAGLDFTSVEYTLVFNPGEISLELIVPVIGDLKDEPNEVLIVTLSDAYMGIEPLTISDDSGVGTIIDDDEAPTVSIVDSYAVELDGTNTAQMVFTVTLSNPSSQALTFDWRILQLTNSDGSSAVNAATVNVDYTDETSSIVFTEDTTSVTLDVTIKGDNLDEYDEQFLVRLTRNSATPASAATLTDDTAFGVILDDNLLTPETTDDDLPPFVSITTINAMPFTEGHAGYENVQLEISLGRASGRAVQVSWNTTRGTALDSPTLTEAADFVSLFETTTFYPGETTKTITVQVIGDTTVETNEHFFVNLLSTVNGRIGTTETRPNHAVVTIDDDESGDQGPWYVQFSEANYSVTEGGTATITLVRAGNSSFPVAAYWISGGTAQSGNDYDGALNPGSGGQRGLVRFGPGETSKTFTIETYDNKDSEGNSVWEHPETILLTLANPYGGRVRGAIPSATLTIIDDEPLPVITIRDASSTGHFAVEETSDGILGILEFTVEVSGASEVDVQVEYASISGTAIAEDDFTTKGGVLTFLASDLNNPQTITITTKHDDLVEGYEDLFVVLSNPLNAEIGDDPDDNDDTGGDDSDDRGYGLIIDDDEGLVEGIVFFDANSNGFLDGATDYGFAGVDLIFTNVDTLVEYEASTTSTGGYSVQMPLGDYTITIDESELPEGASATSFVLPLWYSLAEASAILDFGYAVPETAEVPNGSTGSGTTGNNDSVYGGAGNDLINGGSGDDWLVGGHWLGPGGACEGLPYDLKLTETVSGETRTRIYVAPSLLPPLATIRGRAWLDTDNDNTELNSAGNESGVVGVQVNLFDSNWTLVATTYTNETGNYIFSNLTATEYRVQFLPPGGYAFTARDIGGPVHDSDVDAAVGLTDLIPITAGATEFHVDAGLEVLPAGHEPLNVSFGHIIYSTRETDLGTVITLLGDGASAYPVAVYFTEDGTAEVGIDYLSARGTIRFGTGETEKLFFVPVLPDDDDGEGYETVLLILKSPTGGVVNGAQKTATLLIFDNPCPDDDSVYGGEGNDTLLGDFGYFSDAGAVILLGGMGNDSLHGEEGNDLLEGEGGNDLLEGGMGDDTLHGGGENDLYVFDTDFVLGSDEIDEEPTPFGGSDTLDFSTSGLGLDFDLSSTSSTIRDGATIVLQLDFPADVLEGVLGGAGDDILRGNLRDNVLDGGAGDDLLEGGEGDDDLTGGIGDDLYIFEADTALGHDDIFEQANQDTDTIDFGETTTQSINLDLSLTTSQIVSPTLTLTLNTAEEEAEIVSINGMLAIRRPLTGLFGGSAVSTGIENLYGGRNAAGSGPHDNLAGNSRDNVIWGREGNDHLDGGSAGYDVLKEERPGNWNLTSDSLSNTSTGESDTFEPSTFDEITLIGDDSSNNLDASSFSGVVRLEGRGGADTLIGGSGTNHLSGGEGIDRIDGTLGYDILTEERDADFILTSTGLTIGAETEIFIGLIEEARLIGGALGNKIDAQIFGGPVTLEGGEGDDTLLGSSADDILVGGGGNDHLHGGDGDDAYLFDVDELLGLDKLFELPGAGTDTLDFSPTASVAVEVALNTTSTQFVHENLSLALSSDVAFENILGSQQDDTLTGNSAANVISGNEGSDRIHGGRGEDTLNGGDGTNPAGLNFTDTITEGRDANISLTADSVFFAGILEDTFTGFEAAELTGGSSSNILDASLFTGTVMLDGGAGNDQLVGSPQNDTLLAGPGSDTMLGGLGDDDYVFNSDVPLGSETVTDTAGLDLLDFSGTSTVSVSISLELTSAQTINANLTISLSSSTAIENVWGGALNDLLTGNTLANVIEGGNGHDELVGAGGNDLLKGNDGDDTYSFTLTSSISLGSDSILEDVTSGGLDTLKFTDSTLDGITLDLGIGHSQEVHSLLDLALIRCHSIENIVGGAGNDLLIGNSLNNFFEGGAGDDEISGGLGDDSYLYNADSSLGSDLLIEEPLEGGLDTIDFSQTSSSIGTVTSPFSLLLTTAQTVNSFLTLTLSGAFEETLPGTGLNFISE